jgi:hypothetical protein
VYQFSVQRISPQFYKKALKYLTKMKMNVEDGRRTYTRYATHKLHISGSGQVQHECGIMNQASSQAFIEEAKFIFKSVY